MTFLNVRSLTVAYAELNRHGDEVTVLAGGTDLMVQTRAGQRRPKVWLGIANITELSGVERAESGRLEIGALTTHRALATDELVTDSLPALAAASATVGGWQTQEAGTLGGNICNASPAADTMPPLLVADACVTLGSSRGARTLPIDEFVLGRRETARRPDELLTAITVEPLAPRSAEVYLKVGPRSAMEVALVGLAVRLRANEDGTVDDIRVAAGSVAPVAFRATEAERMLIGSSLDPSVIAAAGDALAAAARPVDDTRASAAYRRRVLPGLLARAIERCRTQIGN